MLTTLRGEDMNPDIKNMATSCFNYFRKMASQMYPELVGTYQWKRVSISLINDETLDYKGRAYLSCSNIEVNTAFPEDIEDTVIHELAHIIDHIVYKGRNIGSPHFVDWISIVCALKYCDSYVDKIMTMVENNHCTS